MISQMFDMAQALETTLITQRRDFHRYPELGWCELRTSSIIARKLTDLKFDEVLTGRDVCDADSRMGLPSGEELERQYRRAEQQGADAEFLPRTRGGFTGAIGILHCGEGPTVALRFDIDALPLTETAEAGHFPADNGFRSLNDGVMHACGHDGHATVGLGVAEVLSACRSQLHGTVKLIFQPAEEGVRGARSIVEQGHLDGVDYVLGAHMGGNSDTKRPFLGVGDGASLATTKLNVTYKGRSSHAGVSPEFGRNAMLAAATAVLNLHAIPRFGSAATRVNVGKLVAGTGRNLICDNAKLELEVRGNSREANDFMYAYAKRVIVAAAEMQGCESEIDLVGAAQCTHNSPELSARVLDILKKAGLPAEETSSGPSGSEDYSYLSERVQQNGGQSCYFNNISCCRGPFHNNHFDFEEAALVNGVKAFCAVTAALMQ